MPELPEVETVARQLAPVLRGERVLNSEVLDPRLGVDLAATHGKKIAEVFRLGKQVVLKLSPGPLYLAVHLRMTGRLIWKPEARSSAASQGLEFYYRTPVQERSLRAFWQCKSGILNFYDTRRFGTIVITADRASLAPSGVDPFSKDFTVAALARMLNQSSQPLKQWLLRQDRIVGLGNIYASEILYACKLSPFRTGASLEPKALALLHRKTLAILSDAIECCGTTFSDFQDSTGSLGTYQECLKVYGREGERCRRCRSARIERVVQAGRSTFFCPGCQR